MRQIFFVFLILSSGVIHAECRKKIDPSKVIIFIDTNMAGKEIASAEAGACARGERLIVIPKDYKKHDELIIVYRKADQDLLKCYHNKLPSSICDAKTKKLQEAGVIMRDKILDYPSLLKTELQQLRKTKAVVKSVIISGHDGGGAFGGDKGEFDSDKIEKVFKEYPDVNKVESTLLLGCYTGVKHEVKIWRTLFPDLRLVGGYDASAPMSDKPEGLEYIQELLINEKKLLEKTDQKKLEKKLFSSIKSINSLNAGIYIKPQCVANSKVDAFYYGSQNKAKGLTEFLNGECQKPEVKKEIKEIMSRYRLYYSGELNPPSDTVNGEMRKIYNKSRKLEHCLQESNSVISLNSVFNLLFFNGVKESFAQFYKDDLKKIEKVLKDSKVIKLKDIWVPTAENLKNKSRKQILDNIYKIHGLSTTPGLPPAAAYALNWLGRVGNQHFVYFQNPFSWHDPADRVEVPAGYSAFRP